VSAKVAVVGHDPYDPAADRLLDICLNKAGWRRSDLHFGQPSGSRRPNLVIAFGGRAASQLVANWPTNRSGQPANTFNRRGYLWQTSHGKVLTTLHPSDCTIRRDPSGINAALFARDLERAKTIANDAVLRRPTRRVKVVGASDQYAAVAELRKHKLLACDIECQGADRTLCIGFAPSAEQAYVFTHKAYDGAFELLKDPTIGKVWQNGQFDLYHLLTREGVRVCGDFHDTQVLWHCMWPEISGKGRSKSKRTAKSLHFLASLYCWDEWWKDYETDTWGMYQLNGRDCCVTFDIFQQMLADAEELGVSGIYRHERRLPPLLVETQRRGLAVDLDRRFAALEELVGREVVVRDRLAELVEPLIVERRDKLQRPELFFKKVTCNCCRGGKAKSQECWSCAGYEKKPTKKQLNGFTLTACAECDGVGKWQELQFNPNSNDQKHDLLFNVLGLPRRAQVDEKTLKNLLGAL
jgi:hypothetical protein